MGRGLRAQCRRRLHPLRHGDRRPEQIEEERRLLYVAMTRARDHLHLVHPLRFFIREQHRHGDRHVYAPRTRFIPDSILDRFEWRTHGRSHGVDRPHRKQRARGRRRAVARDVELVPLHRGCEELRCQAAPAAVSLRVGPSHLLAIRRHASADAHPSGRHIAPCARSSSSPLTREKNCSTSPTACGESLRRLWR